MKKILIFFLFVFLMEVKTYSTNYYQRWEGKLTEENYKAPLFFLTGDEDDDKIDEVIIIDKNNTLRIFNWQGENFEESLLFQSPRFAQSKINDIFIGRLYFDEPERIMILDAKGDILIVNRKDLKLTIEPLKIDEKFFKILKFTFARFSGEKEKENLVVFAEYKKENYILTLKDVKGIYKVFTSSKYDSEVIPLKLLSADMDGDEVDELILVTQSIGKDDVLIEMIKFDEEGSFPKVSKTFPKNNYLINDFDVVDVNLDKKQELILSISRFKKETGLLSYILLYNVIGNNFYCSGEKSLDRKFLIGYADLNGDKQKEIILFDYDYSIKIFSIEKVVVFINNEKTKVNYEPIFLLDKIYVPLSYFKSLISDKGKDKVVITSGKKKVIIEGDQGYIMEKDKETKISDLVMDLGAEKYIDLQVFTNYLKISYNWDILSNVLRINF